jgi:hypothetical protein
MKKINFDFFKFSVVIILIGFLLIFYQFSQNGRYFYISDSKIFDTQTGALWENKFPRGKSIPIEYTKPIPQKSIFKGN